MERPLKYKVATTVSQRDGKTVVSYWDTDVVAFDDHRIILNNGGWWSRTTKLRMNQVSVEYSLGYQVFQRNWEWFVTYKGRTLPFASTTVVLLR